MVKSNDSDIIVHWQRPEKVSFFDGAEKIEYMDKSCMDGGKKTCSFAC